MRDEDFKVVVVENNDKVFSKNMFVICYNKSNYRSYMFS